MPNIHISTGFALVSAVFTVGLVGSVLLFIRSIRKDKLEAAALAQAQERYLNSFRDVPDDYKPSFKVTRERPTEGFLRDRGYITPVTAAPSHVPSSGGYVHSASF